MSENGNLFRSRFLDIDNQFDIYITQNNNSKSDYIIYKTNLPLKYFSLFIVSPRSIFYMGLRI